MLPDMLSLALFVRAAERRSLSKAAEQMHIALAAASRRISILEARYATKLLYRSSKGVQVTPAGAALVVRARMILAEADHLRNDMFEYAQGIRGHIRIHANVSALTQFLAQDVAKFAALNPGVKLDLKEGRSLDIVESVTQGLTDIGVVVEGTPRRELQFFEYNQDELVAIMPRRHPFRKKKAAFAELLKYDIVGLDSSTIMMAQIAKAVESMGLRMHLRTQVYSFEAVCKLVQAGMGVGVLPRTAALGFFTTMGLRLTKLSDPWASRRMYVCVRNVNDLSKVALAFTHHLVSSSTYAGKLQCAE